MDKFTRQHKLVQVFLQGCWCNVRSIFRLKIERKILRTSWYCNVRSIFGLKIEKNMPPITVSALFLFFKWNPNPQLTNDIQKFKSTSTLTSCIKDRLQPVFHRSLTFGSSEATCNRTNPNLERPQPQSGCNRYRSGLFKKLQPDFDTLHLIPTTNYHLCTQLRPYSGTGLGWVRSG